MRFARSDFFTKEAAPRGSKLPTAREGEAENYAKLISRNTIENPIYIQFTSSKKYFYSIKESIFLNNVGYSLKNYICKNPS